MTLAICLILAVFWGAFWALFLQCTRPGKFLAAKRAWLAVCVGIGIDLLILLMVLSLTDWLKLCAVIAVSAIGIIFRSLWNEFAELMAMIEELHRD